MADQLHQSSRLAGLKRGEMKERYLVGCSCIDFHYHRSTGHYCNYILAIEDLRLSFQVTVYIHLAGRRHHCL